MKHWLAWMLAVASLTLASPLAGCASTTGGAAGPAPSGTPTPQLAECANLYQGVPAGRLPVGSQITAATICTGGGQPVQAVDRATAAAGLDRLADVLAKPDAQRPPDLMCTADIRLGTDFVVTLADGTAMAPEIPLDECGKYDLTALDVLSGLATAPAN